MPVTGLPGSTLSQPGNFGLAGAPHTGDVLQALPGVVAHWRFDDRGGSKAGDECGADPGFYSGSFTQGLNGAGLWAVQFGDAATGFDDVNGVPGSAEGTVRVFFKPLALPAHDGAFPDGTRGSVVGVTTSPSDAVVLVLYLTETGQARLSTGDGGLTIVGPQLELGRWHEFVFCWSAAGGGYVSLYVDGTQYGHATHSLGSFGGVTFTTRAGYSAALTGYDFVGGLSKKYVGAPGVYDEIVVANVSHDPMLAPPASVVSQTLAWQGTIFDADVLVTQGTVEAVCADSPDLRATVLQAETLRTGNYRGRLSTFSVEALCGPTAALYSVSATTGVDVGDPAAGTAARDYSVSAATGLRVGDPAVARVTSGGHDVVGVGALTGLSVGDPASETRYVTQRYFPTATTGLSVGSVGRAARDWLLHAASGVAAGGFAPHPGTSAVFVAATTGLAAGADVLLTPALLRPVSATTAVGVGLGVGWAATYALPVAATTAVSVPVSARSAASRARSAAAASALLAGSAGSEARAAAVRAATALAAGAASSSARDVHVSATTGIAAGLVDGHRPFPSASATTGVVVYVSASAAKTGTPAASGLSFLCLATAQVWLKWRQSPLTGADGGGLPH